MSLIQKALKLSLQPQINSILKKSHIPQLSSIHPQILDKSTLPDESPKPNLVKKTDFTYYHNKTTYKQKFTHPFSRTNFFYVEGTETLYGSKLGVAKMRLPNCFLTFNHENGASGSIITIHNPYFETAGFRYKRKPRNTMLAAERHLRFFIHNMNYLAKRRFQLRGRGYKMFQDENNLAFKINYAHLIYHNIRPGLKLYEKARDQEWNVMAGLFPDRVGYETWKIQQYRIPNTYIKSGKGFFRFGVHHLFKEPKKSR